MTEEETKARSVLTLSIRDADAAQRNAAKAREAVTAASTMLNEAERDLRAARTALEEARAVRRPLSELLAEVVQGLGRQVLLCEVKDLLDGVGLGSVVSEAAAVRGGWPHGIVRHASTV